MKYIGTTILRKKVMYLGGFGIILFLLCNTNKLKSQAINNSDCLFWDKEVDYVKYLDGEVLRHYNKLTNNDLEYQLLIYEWYPLMDKGFGYYITINAGVIYKKNILSGKEILLTPKDKDKWLKLISAVESGQFIQVCSTNQSDGSIHYLFLKKNDKLFSCYFSQQQSFNYLSNEDKKKIKGIINLFNSIE